MRRFASRVAHRCARMLGSRRYSITSSSSEYEYGSSEYGSCDYVSRSLTMGEGRSSWRIARSLLFKGWGMLMPHAYCVVKSLIALKNILIKPLFTPVESFKQRVLLMIHNAWSELQHKMLGDILSTLTPRVAALDLLHE
eukprot:Blabericola_migrator_1__3028@NODE_1880_length_3610_cov_160_881174_g1203_i0_p3_GENE_NODE_1880_length_3610_cov_160_881174_g1203_i0NODE_1880_length_3610_cov_160_881174_g1203_i0_p3_ORF_typecomplete_len139_score1_07_NODE_1880_length_3610_cov_160_881174_g1203_i0141557